MGRWGENIADPEAQIGTRPVGAIPGILASLADRKCGPRRRGSSRSAQPVVSARINGELLFPSMGVGGLLGELPRKADWSQTLTARTA